MYKRQELRQLEHFVTTADFGSTRRAAETLYTSQSSVSKNISMLEEELGVTLFARSNRGVSLTEAGREFYDQMCIRDRGIGVEHGSGASRTGQDRYAAIA